jgi:dynactin complex subunit
MGVSTAEEIELQRNADCTGCIYADTVETLGKNCYMFQDRSYCYSKRLPKYRYSDRGLPKNALQPQKNA